MSGSGLIGSAIPRLDGREKVTGKADYSADIKLPDLLYGAILRCPHPHARVTSVDTSRARQLPGVLAVLGAANTAGYCWYEEQVPLFSDVCRFAGDEVAAVAAESLEVLSDALGLIDVCYEPLPFVVDLCEAASESAPRVHEGKAGNCMSEPEVHERGDVEAGFASAAVVVERTFTTQCALHNAMEPHGCTARWHDDEVTIWVSTQGVHAVRSGIAEKLGLDKSKVRVISEFMGGGFGAKQVDWKETMIATLLARDSQRPVQLLLDRRAENLAVGNRNATRQHVRLGAKANGELCAISVDIAAAGGAYSVAGEASDVGGIYQLQYKCANVRTKQQNIYTNTGPSCAFRGPGFAEGAFGLEQAMDELARQLEIDPFELRQRNYTGRDQKKDLPYSAPDSLRECLARAERAMQVKPFGDGDEAGHKRYGSGVAACIWVAGSANPPAGARLRLFRGGVAELVTGSQDIGTGTRTVLTQIAAETLGYPLERFRTHLGDTDAGLESPTSAGSATVPTLAPAVANAATDLREKLREHFELSNDDELDVESLVERLEADYLEGCGECAEPSDEVAFRTFGAQIADVEVDTRSGEVTVLRLAVAADCGRVINPLLARSQVLGGAIQGLGFALLEERVIDAGLGLVMNANLEDYHVPTFADIPQIEYLDIEERHRLTASPHAMGIGEPPLIPTAAAIANAVFDATGIRITDLPITRRRMLDALSSAGALA